MKKEIITIQDYIDEHTPLYTQNEVNKLLETLEVVQNVLSIDEGCGVLKRVNKTLKLWKNKNK